MILKKVDIIIKIMIRLIIINTLQDFFLMCIREEITQKINEKDFNIDKIISFFEKNLNLDILE